MTETLDVRAPAQGLATKLVLTTAASLAILERRAEATDSQSRLKLLMAPTLLIHLRQEAAQQPFGPDVVDVDDRLFLAAAVALAVTSLDTADLGALVRHTPPDVLAESQALCARVPELARAGSILASLLGKER